MKKAQVNVLIALFAYGSNGGVSSIIPEIAIWLAKTYYRMREDERIDQIGVQIFSDTPVTMTRNQAIKVAQQAGFDMVLMIDSDNEPDGYLKCDPSAKPFWDVAFDLTYDRLLQGKPTVIAAPYCGPPPHPTRPGDEGEVPYLFQWINNASDEARPGLRLHRLNRNEAALMKGVHRVGALPTGVCLITLSACEGMEKPYFRYEMSEDGTEKNSTEDVVFTRNASLLWQEKIGENIVFATCDSWALHHKPKKVGRPTIIPVDIVAKEFREAVLTGHNSGERVVELDLGPEPEWIPTGMDLDVPQSNGHTSIRRGRRKFTQNGCVVEEQDLEAIEQIAEILKQQRPDEPLNALTLCDHHGVIATTLADLGYSAYVGNGDKLLEQNAGCHFGNRVRNIDDPASLLRGEVLQGIDLIVLNGPGTRLIDPMRHLSSKGVLVIATDEDSQAYEDMLELCDTANIEPQCVDGTNVYWITKEKFASGVSGEVTHGAG